MVILSDAGRSGSDMVGSRPINNGEFRDERGCAQAIESNER